MVFGKSCSTIDLWKQKLKAAGGKLSALAPGDRVPKKKSLRGSYPPSIRKLMDYLIWYNTEKPHRGIGNLTPMRYYLNNSIPLQRSNMLWTLIGG